MAGYYQRTALCVCGSRARLDGDGALGDHRDPDGIRCREREPQIEPPLRRRNLEGCHGCGLYLCACVVLLALTGCSEDRFERATEWLAAAAAIALCLVAVLVSLGIYEYAGERRRLRATEGGRS